MRWSLWACIVNSSRGSANQPFCFCSLSFSLIALMNKISLKQVTWRHCLKLSKLQELWSEFAWLKIKKHPHLGSRRFCLVMRGSYSFWIKRGRGREYKPKRREGWTFAREKESYSAVPEPQKWLVIECMIIAVCIHVLVRRLCAYMCSARA